MKAANTKALQGLDLRNMRGIEFGPLDRPKVYKDESEIYYIDHVSTEGLKAKYQPGDAAAENLAPIDFVADGRPLKELIGNRFPLDYAVASHVIEHVPDLAGWLKDIEDVLRPGGVLALWIPDKRFTWDIYRRLTSRHEVAQAHAERRTRPGLRVVMDHFAYAAKTSCWHLWEDYSLAKNLPYEHGPEYLDLACRHFNEGKYVDVHNWVFTPWSFMDLMGWMVEEYGLTYNLRWYQTTPQHDLEFMVQLEKSETGSSTTDWGNAAHYARQSAKWPKDGARLAVEYGLSM